MFVKGNFTVFHVYTCNFISFSVCTPEVEGEPNGKMLNVSCALSSNQVRNTNFTAKIVTSLLKCCLIDPVQSVFSYTENKPTTTINKPWQQFTAYAPVCATVHVSVDKILKSIH